MGLESSLPPLGYRTAGIDEGQLMATDGRSEMMTVREAALYLRISRDLAYELVKQEDFPALRLGRAIRIPRFGLDQWIAQQARLPLSAPVTVTSPRPREH